MHDNLVFALFHGVADSEQPWGVEESVKFICPVPGYDRHFALLEEYGIEMMPVDLLDDGPDVARRARAGQGPRSQGHVARPDLRQPHRRGRQRGRRRRARRAGDRGTGLPHLLGQRLRRAPPHRAADQDRRHPRSLRRRPGTPTARSSSRRPPRSRSPAPACASSAAPPANIEWYLKHLGKRTIGPDKVNQLRHARFLKSTEGVHALMDGHRAILAPKFEAVVEILRARLGDYGVASWTEPKGGYFVSLDVVDGTASRVIELAREAGVAMTPAGAAFPYGDDPRDRNIRIAPSYPVAAGARGSDRRARHVRADRRRRASPRPVEPARTREGPGGAGRVRRDAHGP